MVNVVRRKPMSLAEFLDWEERQEFKHEFDGVAPVAMTGGTITDAVISGNVVAALISRLRATPCRAYGSDLKIEVAGSIRYPDAFVACSQASRDTKVVSDPVVISRCSATAPRTRTVGARTRSTGTHPQSCAT
jgi:Uma2 family endonuclease